MRALVSFIAAVIGVAADSQTLPSIVPDEWLIVEQGPSWWYKVKPSKRPIPVLKREPTEAERTLIARARSFTSDHTAKVIALVDGLSIVYADFKAPAKRESLLYGFSVGKTVTAMGVGQAICAGKLSFDTKAKDVIARLDGKPLGEARVRDLLRMASGAAESAPDGSIMTPRQLKEWQAGRLDLLDLVTDERVAKAERGLFSTSKPGEHFAYKSTDPDTLALMLGMATGMTYAQWVQTSILDNMGSADPGFIIQDRHQHGLGEAGIRLTLDDWVRFAWWVKKSAGEESCFGDFVRQAITTQIRNPGTPQTRKAGKFFGGYGYFTWTENELAPNTFWAIGYGGQRVGWSKSSNRAVLVFSNSEEWMGEFYEFSRSWLGH
jgi:CubicO group peptidase (beta-lactamase class C family)